MYRGLLGKKLGMSNLFSSAGQQVPVTVLEVGPCVVTQVKTQAIDGYDALQVGFIEKKAARVSKPEAGHFKKSGGKGFACAIRHLISEKIFKFSVVSSEIRLIVPIS